MKYLGGAFSMQLGGKAYGAHHPETFGEKRRLGLDCTEGQHDKCDRGPTGTGTCQCSCHDLIVAPR